MLSWAFLLYLSVVSSETTPCPEALTEDITIGVKLKNGSILWNGITFDNDKYYEKKLDDRIEIRGCVCEYKACFRKCCPWGEAFPSGERNCNKSIHQLSENFYVPVYNIYGEEVNVSAGHFHVLHGAYCKNGAYKLEPTLFAGDHHTLLEDGTLHQTGPNKNVTHKPDHYCLEVFETDNLTLALVCFDTEPEVEIHEELYSLGMMISLPFLLVTFFVYAFTPELRNLHGLCLMCYVASLFVAYVFLIAIQVGHKTISAGFCTNAPFIIYFAFMVSFLWLNVMCVDIWWTFSGRRGFVGSVRQSEKKRFLIYSIYAWGVALIMVSITALMQYTDLPMHLVKPNFGKGRCWFDGFHSTLYYFYGPMMLLIIINICLFAWTTFLIYQVKRETSRSMRMESHRTGDDSDKQRSSYQFKQNRKFIGDTKIDRFKLYLKLSLVFGVNWSMEILSWLVGGYKEIWYLTDLCNALYGVLIFFIFVCKANVWKLAKKRYYSLMGRPYRAHSYAPTSDNNTRSTGAGDSYAMTTEANNH